MSGGERALVLFSGGQDSTTCLAWALEAYGHVETIGFDYGQRHRVELDRREILRSGLAALKPEWRRRLGEDHMIDLSVLGEISETSLTRDAEIRMTDSGLPNTFVPGRNIVFFTFAAALGYRRGITRLVGGMCETDYSGYPDCRAETMRALSAALSLGMDSAIEIETPLMRLDKAETWALAERLGGRRLVALIVEDTHTCYRGDRGARHAWGFGCGHCPACELRARGYERYVAAKPD